MEGMHIDLPWLIENLPEDYLPEVAFNMIKHYNDSNAAGQIIMYDDFL